MGDPAESLRLCAAEIACTILLSYIPYYLGMRLIIDVETASQYCEKCVMTAHMKVTIVWCQVLLPIHSGYVESMEASRL